MKVKEATGNQTGIKVFSLEDDKLSETRFLNTEYFYSYGVMKNKDYGYFSSFSSGADAIIDFNKDSEIDTIEYEGGKSHYINFLDDGNDRLYVYKDSNKELEFEKNIRFGNESPRLMPLHPNGKRAYLLMQRTNQIVVFDTEGFDELQRIDIPGATIDVDFCGGIFVDKSGTYVCATIRVKMKLLCLRWIRMDY